MAIAKDGTERMTVAEVIAGLSKVEDKSRSCEFAYRDDDGTFFSFAIARVEEMEAGPSAPVVLWEGVQMSG